MMLGWMMQAEEAVATPRMSAQGPAWKCMFFNEIGLNFAMLGTVCGQEPGNESSVAGAAVGLVKIGVRLGACGVLRIRSSVSQSRLEWRSSLIGFLGHKAISASESA